MTRVLAATETASAALHPASGLRAATADEADARARDDAFLLGWSDAIRFADDPAVILAETTARLGARLAATRVNYAEADAAGEALTVNSDWTNGVDSSAGATFPLSALGEAVIRDHLRGDPFLSEDMWNDPRTGPEQRALYRQVQVRGVVTVPLVKAGRLLAVLSIQSHAPRVWTPGEVRLAREVAERTWAVLERARAEAELARSRERLHQAEKLAALGSMLAGVSHELNNPLSIITAEATLLQRRPEGPEVARRAAMIADAAGRCARIVQTFLAIARRKAVARGPVDLNAVAAAALEQAEPDLRAAGVEVVCELDPALPTLRADADQLRQVALHLVLNARQAMAGRDGPRRLTVRTLAGPERTVRLEVADTGPGVAPEHRRRIFEPFFTTKPQGGGAGVGLSFVQGLVEAHGGALTLGDSESGALFRVTLPVDAPAAPAAEPLLPAAAPAPGGRVAVLVGVEPSAARRLASLLADEGLGCVTAGDEAEARAALASGDPALVLGDLGATEIDGPALLAWLTANRPALLDRLAFLANEGMGAAAIRFLQRARRPFLDGPVDAAALRELLRELEADGA